MKHNSAFRIFSCFADTFHHVFCSDVADVTDAADLTVFVIVPRKKKEGKVARSIALLSVR